MSAGAGTAAVKASLDGAQRATLAPPSTMHSQVFGALANGNFERVHTWLADLARQGDPAGAPLAGAWQDVVRAGILAGEQIRSGRGTAGLRVAADVCAVSDGLLLDARRVFADVLDDIDGAAALIRIAEVAVVTGRLDLATDTIAEAAGLLEISPIRNAFAVSCMSCVANLLGDLDMLGHGLTYMRKAYQLSRALGIPDEVAHRGYQLAGMLCEYGEMLLADGDAVEARWSFIAGRDLAEEVLATARHGPYESSLELVLSWNYLGLEDPRAFPMLENLRDAPADLERPWIQAAAVRGLGRAHRLAGNLEQALKYLDEAQAAFRRLGMPRALRSVLRELGETHVDIGPAKVALPAMLDYLENELTRDADQRALCLALFQRRRSVVEDERAAGQLRRLAFEDSLTGLPNRRFAESRLTALLDSAEMQVLAVVDVDSLKQVNDSAGHWAGDLVLCEVARIITQNCRRSDDVCRWAGDEFVILMPNTEIEHAVIALERVRQAIADRDWTEFELTVAVTVSIGAAAAARGDDGRTLFAAADGLLYAAKREGRNRVWRSSAATGMRHTDPRVP